MKTESPVNQDMELGAIAALTKFILNEEFRNNNKNTHLSITYTLNGIPYTNQDPRSFTKLHKFSDIDLILVHLFVRTTEDQSKVNVYSAKIHLSGDEQEKNTIYCRELEKFCKQNYGKGLVDVHSLSYPQVPQKI